MLLNCGVGEDSWESLRQQGDPTSPSWRRSVLGVHWKFWCWSWNSNTLPTSCEKLTHLKRPWCWERLKTREEGGDDRGWDGWMASPTQWTWVWMDSGSWWWTGRPGVLQSTGSYGWVTELMSVESVMPSNYLILCCPLLLLPSIFPSIRIFSSESALHIRWLKYWSFSFLISPSNEHSGLISSRIDWFDLLAVQETLKSFLQPHNLKASIFWHSAFFMVQLSHPYMTTGRIIALTIQAFVGKQCLCFLMCYLGLS